MVKPNLRQTIILGIAIFTLSFGGIALLSLSNINRLQQEVIIVERADDLRNLILEIRREEKNFFLYQDTAFFSLGQTNIAQAQKALTALSEELGQPLGKQHGLQLEQGLHRYKSLLEKINMGFNQGKMADNQAEQSLRETGQNLVEHSRAIAEFERESILRINRRLRTTLIISMGVIALVVLALVIFVSKSILTPLRKVQEATRQIAQGTFEPLTINNTHDEIQQVFVALNSMVDELKKRQIQLVQAQKLSSIGTLASGIAHQLNNPLNNISTSAQILEESNTNKDDISDKMMGNIIRETIRARDIVKGLLEFSRDQDFSPALNSLGTVIQGAVRLVASQLGPRISLNVDVPDSLVLPVDRQRLQEAFINLIINAIQAIGEQEGSIQIQAAPTDGHVLISVKDSGNGMSAETLQRIFDPFFSTKEVGQGTGLGLYIVYGIIEKHQGTIRVESTPGQGTTFFIRLPLTMETKA